MPLMPIRDGTLYYEDYGSGVPLMLAAGLGGLGSFWAAQLPVLTPHFRVIIHDHRGTGQSSRDLITYSVAQMARDVLDLADGLGLRQFHFAGHSTGAAIGQDLMLHDRDRLLSAILASGWSEEDAHFKRCFEIRTALLTQVGPAAYVRGQALFLYPPWYIAAHDAALTKAEAAFLAVFPPAGIVLSRIAAICAFAPGRALHSTTTPTLVVCAADDGLTPAYASQRTHELVPGSELAILPSGGHYNPVTRADEFNATIVPWLLAQRDGTSWTRPSFAADKAFDGR